MAALMKDASEVALRDPARPPGAALRRGNVEFRASPGATTR